MKSRTRRWSRQTTKQQFPPWFCTSSSGCCLEPRQLHGNLPLLPSPGRWWCRKASCWFGCSCWRCRPRNSLRFHSFALDAVVEGRPGLTELLSRYINLGALFLLFLAAGRRLVLSKKKHERSPSGVVDNEWNVKKQASRSCSVGPVGIRYMGYQATEIQLDGRRS